mgnify:CR=1 FL=1
MHPQSISNAPGHTARGRMPFSCGSPGQEISIVEGPLHQVPEASRGRTRSVSANDLQDAGQGRVTSPPESIQGSRRLVVR